MEFSEDSHSILEAIGRIVAPIFSPLGFGHWASTVATISGLVAKEVVVSTFGVVGGLGDAAVEDASWIKYTNELFTSVSALSFMLFNQLCIPCFAAVGAMREEMNSAKWSWFTVAYQIGFAYAISLIVFQFGNVFVLHQAPTIWTAAAGLVLALILYMMFRKPKEVKEDVKEAVAVNNK